jgi:hypothetical protein
MKIAFGSLCTAAALVFAAITVASPAQGKPCETPDGSVTQACMDCINHAGGQNGDPQPGVEKCGYPGTVAKPPQNPQGQNP